MFPLDWGYHFLGKVVGNVNHPLHIKKVNTMAYHPQTNGLIKWLNGTLQTILAKYVSNQQHNWDQLLLYALMAYHTQPHEVR